MKVPEEAGCPAKILPPWPCSFLTGGQEHCRVSQTSAPRIAWQTVVQLTPFRRFPLTIKTEVYETVQRVIRCREDIEPIADLKAAFAQGRPRVRKRDNSVRRLRAIEARRPLRFLSAFAGKRGAFDCGRKRQHQTFLFFRLL